MPDTPIFFIVGKGRSGTTLLEGILDAHPNIQIPTESRFVIHNYYEYYKTTNWTREKIYSFYKNVHKGRHIRLWDIDEEKLLRDLLSLEGQSSFGAMCKNVYLNYNSFFPKEELKLIVDKHPFNTLYINELLKVFPDAKFIHVIRDYRDNVLSHSKAFKLKNFSIIAQKWLHYNKLVDELKSKIPERFITIRYEDLVSDPAKTLQDLCAFLGVEYHSGMLEYHKNKALIDPKLEVFLRQIHPNLFKPILPDNIEKWKKEMSPEEITLCDAIAGSYGKGYGYSPVNSSNNFKIRLKKTISGWWYKNWVIRTRLFHRLPVSLRYHIYDVYDLFFDHPFKEFEELSKKAKMIKNKSAVKKGSHT